VPSGGCLDEGVGDLYNLKTCKAESLDRERSDAEPISLRWRVGKGGIHGMVWSCSDYGGDTSIVVEVEGAEW
jgi:hypothetical protein